MRGAFGVAMDDGLKNMLAKVAAAVGYDVQHITRTVAYREIDRWLDSVDAHGFDALEISAGWKWRQRQWRSFTEMNWPEQDICKDIPDRQYDIVIADNVWEHLLYPYRATRNVHAMLRPGGWFVNITPFLIRYHPICRLQPLDRIGDEAFAGGGRLRSGTGGDRQLGQCGRREGQFQPLGAHRLAAAAAE